MSEVLKTSQKLPKEIFSIFQRLPELFQKCQKPLNSTENLSKNG